MENLKSLLTQTVQENKQLKSDISNWLNLKKIWLKTIGKEKPPPQILLPLIPPLAQKLLKKKFSPYPYGNPLRTTLVMKVLQTSDVKINEPMQPVAKLNLKIQMCLK